MSGKFSGLCFIVLPLALMACATGSKTSEFSSSGNPVTQVSDPMKSIPVKKSTSASLYNDASSRNFFQDLRAYQVGDLVTVNIVETSSASKNAGTKTSRDSSVDASLDNVLGWENKLKYLTSFGNKNVGNSLDKSSLLKASMGNSYDGSGTTTRDESMTAYITVRVMDVMPNGNLFIQGTREVKVNNETQHIILSGTIRPSDISPNNTVLSTYIGDAKIEYTGRGALSDKQSPGWLTRVVDFVWPF
jgi:flagellar L-ring protein FlgH